MKRLVILLCLLSQYSFGQISGRLIAVDSTPVAYANILLENKSDNTNRLSMVSNAAGLFVFHRLDTGRYTLTATAIGYDRLVMTVAYNGDSINLGTMAMTEQSIQMDNIVIRNRKPEISQTTEGLTIDISKSLTAKGNSLLELLEKLPGITIDRRNNGLLLNSKSGITVSVNGSPIRISGDQLIQWLSTQNAENIEKIELLTAPGVAYDADGNGIINIIMKQEEKPGTYASLSLMAGYGWREKAQASLQLSHHNQKLTTRASYTFSYDNTTTAFHGVGGETLPSTGKMSFDFVNASPSTPASHNFNAGLEYRFTPKWTLNGNVLLNTSNRNFNTKNQGIYGLQADSILLFNGHIAGNNSWKNIITSAEASYIINPKNKLIITADYLRYTNEISTDIESYFQNKCGTEIYLNNQPGNWQKGSTHADINIGVMKTDFQRQITNRLKLAAGIKTTYSYTANESGVLFLDNGDWKERTGFDNRVTVNEKIYAAYISNMFNPDSSLNISSGLRFEYYTTGFDGKHIQKSRLFPNIAITKKLSTAREIQLSFSSRIQRPTYNDLASYLIYNDPFSVFTGNPFLKPAYTYSVRSGYKHRRLTFSLQYDYSKNLIANGQNVAGGVPSVAYISPQNISYQKSLLLQVIIPYNLTDWWTMQYTLSTGWNKFRLDYNIHPVEKSFLHYAINFNQSFRLPAQYSIELSGWYSSRSYWGNSRNLPVGSVNAGVKKVLKENYGTLQLTITDIFRTMYGHGYYGEFSQDAFSSYYHIRWESESARFPIFRLSYSVNFGKKTRVLANTDREESLRIRRE